MVVAVYVHVAVIVDAGGVVALYVVGDMYVDVAVFVCMRMWMCPCPCPHMCVRVCMCL